MPGPSNIIDENEVQAATPSLIHFANQFRAWRAAPVWTADGAELRAEVRFEGQDFWLDLTSASGAKLAVCCAPTFGPATLTEEGHSGSRRLFVIEGPLGLYDIQIDADPGSGFIHWTTTLRPHQDLRIASWPCDLYPLDGQGDPFGTRGVVHTKQHGSRAAFLFASVMRPQPGSWLYFQNLTALNPYFEHTRATPADRIGTQWPELGFSLPPTREQTLRKGSSVIISDGYLLATSKVPSDPEDAADLFLKLYSEMYLRLPRPEAAHRDWPRRVDETLYDLTNSPGCTVTCSGRRYLRAYFAQDNSPPESMVQLAVLVPLLEYAASRKEKIPLIRELESNIPTFFNRTIGSIGRWLPGTESWFQQSQHREEQEGENVMDSWYLYHTYLNLSRLAAAGNATARRLFFESLEYGIKVARHFGYRWPILFDIYSLKAIRSEEAPGKGGEGDVGAQYVHVMQQAWNLTRDQRYVEEAELAARCLQGLGFELGYQYNNTSFGAGALMWLWKHTGKELYRKQCGVHGEHRPELLAVIAAMAQFEREETVDRLKSSIAIRAKLGKPLGGPAPFGYQWKDKKLMLDPSEAPVRKRMYELFLEHKRKKTVTRLLNEAGHRTRNGSRFSPKTVGRLLEDPTAKGLRRGNYTTRSAPKENWKFKPETEWVFTEVDPIVSEDVWRQCNEILAQTEKLERKPTKKVVHLFAGLTFCECGEKMYVPSRTPKYVCQKCRNRIPIEDLNSGFYEHLTNYFISPENVAGHIQDADSGLQDKQNLLAVQQTELGKIKKETDLIYGLVLEDHITKDAFGRRQKNLEERQTQLEMSIGRLQAEIDLSKVNRLSTEEIVAEATDLKLR